MNDELLLRMWTAEHCRLSQDLDDVLTRLRGALSRRTAPRKTIDQAYATPKPAPHSAKDNVVSALAAIATTTALLLTVAAVITPDQAHERTAAMQQRTVIELA